MITGHWMRLGLYRYLIFATVPKWHFTIRARCKMTDSSVVADNLRFILKSIDSAVKISPNSTGCRLVAVSKTKPADLVKECYAIGQRYFGENYVNELEEKSVALVDVCPDIKWHYIGQIQSNKITKICSCPSLRCVETIASQKHCDLFEKEIAKLDKVLDVMVQVNTSSEDQKGGVSPQDAILLASHIQAHCPHLRFAGFMTIGSFEHSHQDRNPDFDVLSSVRDEWYKTKGQPTDCVDLSMGMSDDYLMAIQQGSTSVRVGSKIFGPRLYVK